MSDALSFADMDGQHVELLPARTVLSTPGAFAPGGETTGTATGGYGGHGGDSWASNVNSWSTLNGNQSAGGGGNGGVATVIGEAFGGANSK